MIGSTALCGSQYSLDNFEWSADSKEVTMEYNQRGHQIYRVLAMSATTGDIRTIVEETSKTFVNYSRHYRYDLPDGTLIWMSERDNWNHLYLYDKQRGRVIRQITRGNWCVREVVKVDEKPGVIYFAASGMNSAEDPYLVHYYRIGIDGKHLQWIPIPRWTKPRLPNSAVLPTDISSRPWRRQISPISCQPDGVLPKCSPPRDVTARPISGALSSDLPTLTLPRNIP